MNLSGWRSGGHRDKKSSQLLLPTFTASTATKNIYPALKPVLNKEKKIIGFKAVLNPKLLIEKFKQSEEVMLLLKVK